MRKSNQTYGDGDLVPFCESKVSEAVFDAWLTGKSEQPEGAITGSQSPREALQAMVDAKMSIDAPDGSKALMSIMEGIMMRYVNMALEGDLEAIKGIIKELQHEGITKVAVAHVDTLPPGAQFILDQVGYKAPTNAVEGTTLTDRDFFEDSSTPDEPNDPTGFLDGL